MAPLRHGVGRDCSAGPEPMTQTSVSRISSLRSQGRSPRAGGAEEAAREVLLPAPDRERLEVNRRVDLRVVVEAEHRELVT